MRYRSPVATVVLPAVGSIDCKQEAQPTLFQLQGHGTEVALAQAALKHSRPILLGVAKVHDGGDQLL